MTSLFHITFILGIILSPALLLSKPLIAPDTVFINPANYNPNSNEVGIYTLFELHVNNHTGLEIISMGSEINLSIENPEDKSLINTLPFLIVNKTGNIYLEDRSTIAVKANIFYDNPKSYKYETDMFINYKTKENGFLIDTVHIIANRVDSKLYTMNQKLTREVCDGNEKSELFKVYSTLINGTNKDLRIDSINFRSEFNLSIVGYLNKLFDNNNPPEKNINFPYNYSSPYLTVEIEFNDSLKKDNSIYIDYFTEEGLFTDTVSIAYTKMKGITAKSYFQSLKSINYDKVESKSIGMRLCSEQGYRVKSIRLEGEIDENEIELEEFIKVGDIIDSTFAELARFVISPQHIPFERMGAYIYELENMATGNIINIDFPFTLKIELTTNVDDYKYNETHIYPNPVKDVLNISSKLNIIKAEIIDQLGKVIYYESNSNPINVRNISKGFYFLRLTTKNNTFIEKVIIE